MVQRPFFLLQNQRTRSANRIKVTEKEREERERSNQIEDILLLEEVEVLSTL